jgi:hypothetical protein
MAEEYGHSSLEESIATTASTIFAVALVFSYRYRRCCLCRRRCCLEKERSFPALAAAGTPIADSVPSDNGLVLAIAFPGGSNINLKTNAASLYRDWHPVDCTSPRPISNRLCIRCPDSSARSRKKVGLPDFHRVGSIGSGTVTA